MQTPECNTCKPTLERLPMYGSVWLSLFRLLREGRNEDCGCELSRGETSSRPQ